MKNATSGFQRYGLKLKSIGARLLCLLLMTLSSPVLAQREPVITGSMTHDGRIVVLYTDEPHLYYVMPERWQVHKNRVYLERGQYESDYDLIFILAPDYSWSLPYVRSILAMDPAAIFLPLPKHFSRAELFVPTDLGSIRSALTPLNPFNISELLYFRLGLREDQLHLLQKLTENNNFLTGFVTYEFPFDHSSFETFSDIVLKIHRSQLELNPRPLIFDYEWILHLVDTHQLYLENAVDGRFSLGGLIWVAIENSLIEGYLAVDKSKSSMQNGRLVLTANEGWNFYGRITLDIAQIVRGISIDFQSKVNLEFDLASLSVFVTNFELESISIADQQLSTTYVQAFKKYLNQKSVLDRVSKELSRELEKRILEQNLFLQTGVL